MARILATCVFELMPVKSFAVHISDPPAKSQISGGACHWKEVALQNWKSWPQARNKLVDDFEL